MKPRRDSGAVRVSPIMSEVRMGSAVIVFISSLDGSGIEQAIASERKSRAREESLDQGDQLPGRK
jgi:hypothetical protein